MAETEEQNAIPLVERLGAWNPAAVADVSEFRGETTIVLPGSLLRAVAAFCREDAALQFNLLSDIVCVDRFPMEPRFEVNYHLTAMTRRAKIRLRVRVSGADPVLDTVSTVWPGANWMEREVFDLFGVRFAGHSDLRRILLPDDWEGHPLRKDYATEGPR